MLLSDFDFPFDPALVALQPVIPRDHARLLVLTRKTGQLDHRHLIRGFIEGSDRRGR